MNIKIRMCSAALLAIAVSVVILEMRAVAFQAVTTVSDAFRPFYEGAISKDRLTAVRAALPFERVTLERRGGMVLPSGAFRLTLAKNGEASLWSDEARTFGNAGDFIGTVSVFDFGKLSHLISQVGVEKLNRRYATNWTDQQTLTVSVTAGRDTVTIDEYGGAGPVQLWSIEEAMMAIGHAIVWRRR